jgi:hypothetical protein
MDQVRRERNARQLIKEVLEMFKPVGSGSNCGYECHTRVKAKDYIFHPYQKR